VQKISAGSGDGEADGSRGDILATKRGGEWTLEGDGNTKFFHLVANGRRRKNLILPLEHDWVNVTEPEQIQKIIYDYYKSLFGRHLGRGVRIGGNAWVDNRRLSSEDNNWMTRPFTEEEVKEIVFEMNEDSAPVRMVLG
jgi:mannosylglycoprotein endo-beta-mannosidase